MTSTLPSSKTDSKTDSKTKSHQRSEGSEFRFYTKGWVVPSLMVRDLINENRHVWQADATTAQIRYQLASFCERASAEGIDEDQQEEGNHIEPQDTGWRTQLAIRVSAITGTSFQASVRNLYRVMSGESDTIRADFADAVCMTLAMTLDGDTNIPVLPGNLKICEELLEVRDPKFWGKNPRERRELLEDVMRLTMEILNHPEQLEQIQDRAPFDCLRPPQVQ